MSKLIFAMIPSLRNKHKSCRTSLNRKKQRSTGVGKNSIQRITKNKSKEIKRPKDKTTDKNKT